MKTHPLRRLATGGFSLVEMLVVISVIGVVAAIAIPNIGNIGTSAKTATNQRNAQSIVAMYSNGSAAGIVWSGADRNSKVQAVVSGAIPSDGAFAGKEFKIPNLGLSDQQGCYPYIGYDVNGELFYDKSGSQSSS